MHVRAAGRSLPRVDDHVTWLERAGAGVAGRCLPLRPRQYEELAAYLRCLDMSMLDGCEAYMTNMDDDDDDEKFEMRQRTDFGTKKDDVRVCALFLRYSDGLILMTTFRVVTLSPPGLDPLAAQAVQWQCAYRTRFIPSPQRREIHRERE